MGLMPVTSSQSYLVPLHLFHSHLLNVYEVLDHVQGNKQNIKGPVLTLKELTVSWKDNSDYKVTQTD